MPEGDVPIQLEIRDWVAEFESHDTGHPLADPQTYVLGPAFVSLAHAYLGRAFEIVPGAVATEPRRDWAYSLDPWIANFDNTLEFGAATQKIEVGLRTRIHDRSGEEIAVVDGWAENVHGIGRFNVEPSHIEAFVHDVLEVAMQQLTLAVVEQIALHTGEPVDTVDPMDASAIDCGSPCRAVSPAATYDTALDEADLAHYREALVLDFTIAADAFEQRPPSERTLARAAARDLSNGIAEALRARGRFERVRRSGTAGEDTLVVAGLLSPDGEASASTQPGTGGDAPDHAVTVELRDGVSGATIAGARLAGDAPPTCDAGDPALAVEARIRWAARSVADSICDEGGS